MILDTGAMKITNMMICPSSRTAETADLDSVIWEFESPLGYQINKGITTANQTPTMRNVIPFK